MEQIIGDGVEIAEVQVLQLCQRRQLGDSLLSKSCLRE